MRTRARLLSPVRLAFDYEVVRRADGATLATGHTVHATIDRPGRPVRLPARVQGTVRHEGTGHRRRGVHRLAPERAAARAAAPTSSASTASPTTTRGRSRNATSRPARPRPATGSSRATCRTPICRAARRRHPRVPPGGAGRRAQELGPRLPASTPLNIDATQVLLEACVGRPHRAAGLRLELVGLRRRRRDADARGRAAAAGVAVRRHQAGRRAALPPVSTSTTACRRCRCATSRSTGPRQRPDMGFHRFFTRGPRRPAARAVRRRAADPRLHLRGRRGDAPPPPPPSAGRPGRRLQYWRRVARVAARGLRPDRPRLRPAADRSIVQPPQKGDMRDTYADTSRAQADLGFAPSVGLEDGLRGDVRVDGSDPEMIETFARCCVLADRDGRAARPACGASRTAACRRARPKPTSSCSTAAARSCKERKWLTAREYFRQIVDNYPQSPFRPDAKLARRRHLHRRGHDRIAAAGDQRVPRVPDLLPDACARRLRAVPAGAARIPSRCWRPSAIRPPRATPSRSSRSFLERYPEQRADARARRRDARGQGPPERGQLPRRLLLLPRPAGIPAPSTASAKCCPADPEFTNRDAVYFHLAESLRLVDRSRPKRCPTTNGC